MNYYYYETIKFKEIAPSFEIFKSNVEKYNFMSEYTNFLDSDLKVFYSALFLNFHNCYIREETGDDFYMDLTIRLLDNYDRYIKIFKTIQENIKKCDLISDSITHTEYYGENTQDSTSSSKSAETPTSIRDTSKSFIDQYTNMESAGTGRTNGINNGNSDSTHKGSIVDALEKSKRLVRFGLDSLINEFSNLFTQIEEEEEYHF